MWRILALVMIGATVATPRVTSLLEGEGAGTPARAGARARRCSMVPGAVRAVVAVVRDTTVTLSGDRQRWLANLASADLLDTTLAMPDTPMPAARVRVLRLDSATRAVFLSAGISSAAPEAFIRAAPYRGDCLSIKWTDTVPWTQAGDTGYVVAHLASREHWIGNRPVLVVAETWNYPYPRHPGPFYPSATPPRASAVALFSYANWMARGAVNGFVSPDSALPLNIAWAKANVADREHDPIRSEIRKSILADDFNRANQQRSRFRGTYRVELTSGNVSASWQFRTVDRPEMRWLDMDTIRSIADVLASPHISGYRLGGVAADSAGTIPSFIQRGTHSRSLTWLSVADRPTTPRLDSRPVVQAMLEFKRYAAPRSIWEALTVYVPAPQPYELLALEYLRNSLTAGDDQPRLPFTLRVAADGRVSGDTTIVRGGRRLRVRVTRVDTLVVRRTY